MKLSEVFVSQSCLTLCDPMDCSCSGSSLWNSADKIYWSGLPIPSPDLPERGIKPGFSILLEDSLPSEPLRKPYYSL